MKKIILLLSTILLAYTSCSKDDKVKEPELHKMTRIECVKNNMADFSLDIVYIDKGDIKQITKNNGEVEHFIYSGNKLSIASTYSNSSSSDFTHTIYEMNKGRITEKALYDYHPYNSNDTYISDVYTYHYNNSGDMTSISWKQRWPLESGGYDENNNDKYYTFDWSKDNISQFYGSEIRMVYEYSSTRRPENFPFRVWSNTNPTGIDNFSPVNFLFGYMGKYLPTKAYWYDANDRSQIKAEYDFTYNTFISEYLTAMTIQEKIYPNGNGTTYTENTYEYSFVYDYDPN